MKSILSILLDKYKQQKLAPFYIARFQDYSSVDQLVWAEDLLEKIYQSENLSFSWSRADVLLISPQENKNQYMLNDVKKLDRFLEYAQIELSWRFVIFEQAELLTIPILNKLLKTLEAPGQNVCILFLAPSAHKFIQTIESRALSLSIGFKNEDGQLLEILNGSFKNMESKDLSLLTPEHHTIAQLISQYITGVKTLHDCVDHLKDKRMLARQFFDIFTLWSENNCKDFHQITYALSTVKSAKECFKYHNCLITPLTKALQLMMKTEKII
ncbi:MAG: hypothetical protein H6622_15670 [Halobacteriovoraceae bacterium]|nr:hypothetical protein [Halobacteriovoraceae bacterium]